jgi:hypothetical protein
MRGPLSYILLAAFGYSDKTGYAIFASIFFLSRADPVKKKYRCFGMGATVSIQFSFAHRFGSLIPLSRRVMG